MKQLYKFFIIAIFLMAAQCNPVPEPDISPDLTSITYDMVKLSLSYGQIPQEGGTVSPMLEYEYTVHKKWSDGKEEDSSETTGAKVSYSIDNDIFSLSQEGKVSATAGNGLSRTATVTAEIKVSDKTWTTTAKVIQVGNDCVVEYCDLMVTEFSYPAVPQEGGSTTPVLTYTYTRKTTWADGSVEDETLTEGAACSFTAKDDITLTEDGTATLVANDGVQVRNFTVNVTLEVEGLTANSQAMIVQDGSEDRIVSSATVQLPLELAPHTAVYPIDYYYSDSDTEKDYLLPGNLTTWGGRIAVPWTLEQDDNIQATGATGREDFGGEQGWEGVKKEISYESHSRDGRTELSVHTWKEINEYPPDVTDFYVCSDEAARYESVSASGAEIRISGGQLATVNTYLSGKKDTIIIAEPVYSSSTTYHMERDKNDAYPRRKYAKETGIREQYKEEFITIEDNPEYCPKALINGKTWTIRSLGPDIYVNILHTLKAIVNGYETELTIRQNPNIRVGYTKDSNWMEITGFEPYMYGREYLPDYEDYPYGSNPKWAVRYVNGVASSYFTIDCTRALHPDMNRAVDFRYWLQAKQYVYEYIYLNGTKTHYYHQRTHCSFQYCGEITVKIKADIPLDNNTTRHYSRTYIIDNSITHWRSCPWHVSYLEYANLTPEESLIERKIPEVDLPVFGFCLPTQKDAASDFEWHVEIYTNLLSRTTGNQKIIISKELKRQIENPYVTTITDKKLTWEEFAEKAQISGWLNETSGAFMVDYDLKSQGCPDCE